MISILYRIRILAVLMVFVAACSPKTTEVVTEKPPAVEEKPVVKRTTPCKVFKDLPGSTRERIVSAYVLYKDQFKSGNYQKAYPLWKEAFYAAPAANGSVKYQFEDGIAIYKHFYENTEDPQTRSAYVDTIMSIYDKRLECYGDTVYIAGRKAFDLYYYYPGYADEDEIFDMFKIVLDKKKEKSDYYIINPFSKMLSERVTNEEISIDEGRKYALLLWDAIQYGRQSGENKETWDIINEYAPAQLELLEGIEGFYPCDYYKEKYLALYRENPEDCDIITTAYSRLLWGGCSKDDPAVKNLGAVKDSSCYTPPPVEGTLRRAYTAYTEGRYMEAVRLFDEFIKLTDDPLKKAKYSLLIGKIYYGDIRNFSASRRYAQQAAEYDPSSGAPYLLIGKLYASSGPLCGPGRGWDSQVVVWPAIDMWQIALKDPLVAAEARRLINSYTQYMPSREDIFQKLLKEGQKYQVGCWINRETTIRAAP